jgi:hypothetical protein
MLRGAGAIDLGDNLRVETAEVMIEISTGGKDSNEAIQRALRVANDLYGANDRAAHLTAQTDFVAKPPDLCKDTPVTRERSASITVDADADTSGIQSLRIVTGASEFTIALETAEALSASGYQWELQWDDATLDFVSAVENVEETGATLCAPVLRNDSAPEGKEWHGAGCLHSGGTLPASVRLTTITLRCILTGDVTTEIHLVTGASDDEDSVSGTTFLASGGAQLPTSSVDARVTCAAP